MSKNVDLNSKSDTNYTEELSVILETTLKATSQVIYYFESNESNPLKNVTMTSILADSATFYHTHDFYEVNYVVSGILHENISGKSFTLSSGELLIMAPGVFHACIAATDTVCFNILFKKEHIKRLSDVFKQYDAHNYLSSLEENTIYTIISAGEFEKELSELVQKIFGMSNSLVHHVDLYENLTLENTASEFLLKLTKIPRHEYNFESGRMAQRENFTPNDIVTYINKNFDKINLADTALRFGYSTCQLHRILKKHTGHTFSELILSIRMQRARHYLLNTHLSVKNIAYLLGLDSVEHFTRMFKKHRKMSPTEYRNSYMRLSLQNTASRR